MKDRKLVCRLAGMKRRPAVLLYPVICLAIIASFLFLHSFHRPLETPDQISNLHRPLLLPDAPGYTQGQCEDAPGWTDWASKYVKSRIGRDIVLTNLNWDYVELGFNLYNQTTNLGLDIVLVAEDCSVYKCLSDAFGHSHVLPPLRRHRDAEAQNFNTEGFGRMVSARPVYMHFFLNRGVHVIWEDIDSFPLDNPTKYWTRGADITAVDDRNTGNHYDSTNLCSCLIFSQATHATLLFVEKWMSLMGNGAKTNQHAFNNALKSAKSNHGLTLVILPRTLFPNGATLDSHNATSKWVHANYRVGKQKKIEFLTKHGMDWGKIQGEVQRFKCKSGTENLKTENEKGLQESDLDVRVSSSALEHCEEGFHIRNRDPGTQLGMNQMEWIAKVMRVLRGSPGRSIAILVFGVGNDSPTWVQLNCNGRTIFIEDNISWIKKIKQRHQALEIYQYSYQSDVSQIDEFIQSPIQMTIPDIHGLCFDIFLIDAPMGYTAGTPGRAQPAYFASQNVRNCSSVIKNAVVFMHDTNRKAEQKLLEFYFDQNKETNFVLLGEMDGPHGLLTAYGHLSSDIGISNLES